MATAPLDRRPAAQASTVPAVGGGRHTEHLKEVPQPKAVRERIRGRAIEIAAGLDKSRPPARHEMEAHARGLLAELQLPETYVGWTMVALASSFWHDQVAAVPHHRRLLLLPRCLRNAESCPAECNELGLICQDCGACCLTHLRYQARRKGYEVMIAEGSPAVMKIILAGGADALLGVACLDVLEKTLDKILLAGIPCMAVPLLENGCTNTSADEDWIRGMIEIPHRPAEVRTRSYLHLMRCAAQMFEPAELRRLLPPARISTSLAETNGEGIEGIEPLACTEAIAYDFLSAGGKHSRPFITLAVYDALCGGRATRTDSARPDCSASDCTGSDGARRVAELPDAVKTIALAIETFHKASLVHDDIEDDDALRYDRPTLNRKYGTPTAINVGDYLIGMGYRMVAAQCGPLPAETVADVLAEFARAHTRLCEGQGAELIWRDARQKRLTPLEALKIYALKTSPAFEAALLAGIRLAGPAGPYREPAARFARHLGIAYQILNDLDDWEDGQPNKRAGGSDVLGGRPTVLWALAWEALNGQDRHELESLLEKPACDEATIARARELYRRADACRKATALVSKHHQRALDIAKKLEPEPLRHLFCFLADAILDRRPLAISEQ